MRRLLGVLAAAALVLGVAVAALYITNTTPPLPALALADTEDSAKPIVIKMHAQWCPICRATKGAWSELVDRYAERAHLLVLDFTNEQTEAASEAEVRRLKLDGAVEEFYGATGLVLVVDGRTKRVASVVGGIVGTDDYGAAIDAVLAAR
jgi:thiol-disulfide isomerase/thioredoxin